MYNLKYKDSYIVPELALGELLANVNMANRWVYSGSLTTPPCYENVYWNVIQTVLPIKKHHFDYYYQTLQSKADPASKAATFGNYRTPRPATSHHKLIQVTGPEPYPVPALDEEAEDAAATTSLALIIVFCLAILVVLGLTVYVCILHDDIKKMSQKQGGDKVEGDVDYAPAGQQSVEAPIQKGGDKA